MRFFQLEHKATRFLCLSTTSIDGGSLGIWI